MPAVVVELVGDGLGHVGPERRGGGDLPPAQVDRAAEPPEVEVHGELGDHREPAGAEPGDPRALLERVGVGELGEFLALVAAHPLAPGFVQVRGDVELLLGQDNAGSSLRNLPEARPAESRAVTSGSLRSASAAPSWRA